MLGGTIINMKKNIGLVKFLSLLLCVFMLPQFVFSANNTTMALSWNSLGAGYQYSLDLITKSGQHISACIGADVLGSARKVLYSGRCLDGANTKIPLSDVDTFVLVYTNNGDWVNNAHSIKIKNDPTVSALTFQLTLPCKLNGLVIQDGTTQTLYTKAFSATPASCSSSQVQVSCTDGVLTKPTATLYASCSAITTKPLPVQPGGAPSIIERKDGALISVYNSHINKVTSIDAYISRDKGVTWKYLSTVISLPTPTVTKLSIANSFVRLLSNGDIIAAYRYHDGPIVNDPVSFKTFRLESKISSDGGLTWSSASTIEKIANLHSSNVGLWEPDIIEKPDHTLQAYYAKERVAQCQGYDISQDVMMRESTNGGVSWGAAKTVLQRGASREGVPGVVQTKDATLYAIFETLRDSNCSNPNWNMIPGLAMSTDGGYTWRYLPNIYNGAPLNINNGWPDMIRLRDGRLLARFTLGSNGLSPQVALMITTNVPSKTVTPVWRMVASSGISKSPIGKLLQLSTGEIVNTNTSAAGIPVSVTTIPLASLKAPVAP